MSIPQQTAQAMSPRRVTLIAAMLIAIGPMAMTMYLPAMSELARAFQTTPAGIKMTVTLYFGGFALAQLVAGALSDALGRKPVVLAFFAIFMGASALAIFAPNVQVLIAARFLQGVGAAAGMATARALIRDCFTGQESARALNLVGIIMAIAPALAPTIGGLVMTRLGWQAIFVVFLAAAALIVTLALVFMRETVARDTSRLNARALVGSYRTVLGSRRFLASGLTIIGGISVLYAQASFLPFVLMDELGLTPTQYGLSMLMQTGAFFLAGLAMRFLLQRHDATKFVPIGLVLLALGGLGHLTMLVTGPSFLHVMLPVSIFVTGIAFIMPAMTTASLAPFPHMAGAASSMMGCLQMASGLVVGTLGAALHDSTLAVTLASPTMALVAIASYRAYLRLDRAATDGLAQPAE